MKRCSGKCGKIKPITEFYFEKRRNSYQTKCKQCVCEAKRKKYKPTTRKKAKILCALCGETDPDKFHLSYISATGRQHRCKVCVSAYKRGLDLTSKSDKNKARIRSLFKQWCQNGGKFNG